MNNKRLRFDILALVLSVTLILSMSACKNTLGPNNQISSQSTNTVSPINSINTTNISSTPNTVSYPITVTDQLGRKVTITGEIKNIVSGYYISSSLLIALGLGDKIVGVEAKAKSRPIYSLAAPRILNLPSVGTAKEFDLEGCIALKPDIVILPIKLKDSIAALEKTGLNVLAVNPEDMTLLKETIILIGKATRTEEKATKLLSYYDDKLTELSKLPSSTEGRKTVYLAGNSSLLSTASSKMYQNTMVETAGGKNVAAEIKDTYWATVSYEQLIAFNPDIIIIVPFASYAKDAVLNDSKLQGLKAIKSKTVFKMPDSFEAWDSPAPSGILGTMWLTSILKEKQYSFDAFKSDASVFYKEFYNIKINTEEITK